MGRKQRQELAAELRRAPGPGEPVSIEEARAELAALMGTFAIPSAVRRTPTTLGNRPAVLVEPEGVPNPGTILYFHGGSFSQGSPDTAMALTANLVVRTGTRAISLDYRLAPENPFPAGIEDCLAAYQSLLESGVDPASIVLAGDSAGGSLAITTCLMARDAGLAMPAAVVTFSALTDHTRTGNSIRTKEGIDPFFTLAGLEWTSNLYLAGQDPNQPLASPAVSADLTGFPPILLQVGTNELLLDDSVRFADRAREADVDVVLDVTADVPHVFQAWVGPLDEADQALDRAALFVSQQLLAN